jgi:hypothetical protein
MNEGTRSGKSTIRLLGISAERPTNGLYLLPLAGTNYKHPEDDATASKHEGKCDKEQCNKLLINCAFVSPLYKY